jgi:hypothetical protein
MSRRHGRTHHHDRGHHGAPRPGTPAGPRPNRTAEGGPGQVAPPPVAAERATPTQPATPVVDAPMRPAAEIPALVQAVAGPPVSPVETTAPETHAAAPSPGTVTTTDVSHPAPGLQNGHQPQQAHTGPTGHGGPAGHGPNGHPGPNGQNGAERGSPCTAPQLRRFIKSRPYVPMHELRRRFAIDGDDDDVSPIRLDPGCIFVGLPAREGQLLGELLRAGEIGYELSLDPRTPIVVGVYPMRPVPRP